MLVKLIGEYNNGAGVMRQLSFFESAPTFSHDLYSSWFKEILATFAIEEASNWRDGFGAAFREWSRSNFSPIRTLSLFSGGGGLDIGFHDAGFQIVEMVEIEKKYIKTLVENSSSRGFFAGNRPLCADIRNYVPCESLDVDFIIGGPPCQTFSAAGRRAAGVLGTDDPRGALFQEYVRILKSLKPRGFLYENVYGIVGAQKGRAWRTILDAFREAGYRVYFRILDSADYGVPQHRERLFIVGLREGEFLFPRPTHGEDAVGIEPHCSAGKAVEGVNTTQTNFNLGGEFGHLLADIPPGLNYSFYTEKLGHPKPVFAWRSKFSDFLYKADPERPVRTIKAQGGQYTGPFSWENRPFTISELKRLQSFPDGYKIVGNRQVSVEQIGNSVPPQMARMLALAILDQVFEIHLPFGMHYLQQDEKLGFRKRKRELTGIYREKARVSIDRMYKKMPKKHRSDSLTGTSLETWFISANFDTSRTRLKDSYKIFLRYVFDENAWVFSAGSRNGFDAEPAFETVITPSEVDNWAIPADQVKLRGYDMCGPVYTCLWKAFESHLKSITGVADLVQLCGYYQYSPRIKSEFHCKNETVRDDYWLALREVANGRIVAKQIVGQDFSRIVNVEHEDILEFSEWLRSLGFEVRNRNTNPQLGNDTYLIPYSFPTLTPRSVQLRKTLRGQE